MCAASAQSLLALLKLSTKARLNSHMTEPATVPTERGSLLPSPTEKGNSNSGAGTEQSHLEHLNSQWHICTHPKRARTGKLLQGKISCGHMVHLLLSGNLVLICLVLVATSLSFFARQCHASLTLPSLDISLCSYTLTGTNLCSELPTTTFQIAAALLSARG